MAWYEDALFYHIYPLGLTGAPEKNEYAPPADRLKTIEPWISHAAGLGCTALYIGPLFESVGHGYETTDYRKVDSRLGDNAALARFVAKCHESGLKVILDGVFNHTGRDFFAFRDLKERREGSRYLNWYCGVNFYGNNEYNDGFSYDNWGGYNLLPRLNLKNPEVRDYHLDTVRFWVKEFDIDGLRLDAADVLDFDFMRSLRNVCDGLKEDFWLMGEVIHGDYSRWANERTLHSVTNYHLHKALYSAHNDHNYFEIAHTVRRQADMVRGLPLYNFVDNHDVERIASRLRNPAHFLPVHVLLYALPGIPSLYYGSEFGVEGKKERFSDASLRPCLDLDRLLAEPNPRLDLIRALGKVFRRESALRHGEYRELALTTENYAFARGDVIVTVNNADREAFFDLPGEVPFAGALTGRRVCPEYGRLRFSLEGCGGEIWIPETDGRQSYEPLRRKIAPAAPEKAPETRGESQRAEGKPLEEMTVEELQAEVLARLAANGNVTDRMRREVSENVWRDSLISWVKSFR